MIGIENTGGVAFAFANRAIVIEELTQFFHRIAHIGTQHVFAVELVVHLPYGAFQECYATRMSRAMP